MKKPILILIGVSIVIAIGVLLRLALRESPFEASRPAPQRDAAEQARPSEMPAAPVEPTSTRVAAEEPAAPAVEAGAPGLRDLLARIADIEEALVAGHERGDARRADENHVELERVLAPILDDPTALIEILELLTPDAAGERRLDAREQYGAVRALYWLVVVNAGRGAERPMVLAILEALPRLHADARPYLVDNLTLATIDDRPVLDASYLDVILRLRAAFPEHAELFSSLFEVLGDTMTARERAEFFALFSPELEDPVLVGLTIQNLLKGDDPEFGLFLARQRFDDPVLADAVRLAIAGAVAETADVFSATEFLAERAQELRNAPSLWFNLGAREGAVGALEDSYFGLAHEGADPEARRGLVMGMRTSAPTDLLRIAETDPTPRVATQALLTLTSKRGWEADPATAERVLERLRSAAAPGSGAERPQELWLVAQNVAAQAQRAGRSKVRDEVVALLRSVAEDPSAAPGERRASLDALRPYLPSLELEAIANTFD